MTKTHISFTVNGILKEGDVEPNLTLLNFLREELGLTGAKEGCGNGECGACVVMLNDKPVNSCLVLAVEANGSEILTVEGLETDAGLHPVQQSILDHEAYQCGFCTSGVIMTAYGLLEENPHPTADEARFALAGNMCRCTGYNRIVDAVVAAGEVPDDK
jgi:aerobic carbon-monoxide dehydrogenase small subunit